jgi:hypothetical protein
MITDRDARISVSDARVMDSRRVNVTRASCVY